MYNFFCRMFLCGYKSIHYFFTEKYDSENLQRKFQKKTMKFTEKISEKDSENFHASYEMFFFSLLNFIFLNFFNQKFTKLKLGCVIQTGVFLWLGCMLFQWGFFLSKMVFCNLRAFSFFLNYFKISLSALFFFFIVNSFSIFYKRNFCTHLIRLHFHVFLHWIKSILFIMLQRKFCRLFYSNNFKVVWLHNRITRITCYTGRSPFL